MGQITNRWNDEFKINRDLTKFSFDQKIIKIKATGIFNKSNLLYWLKTKLDDRYRIEYDAINPDYLIYNIFNDDDVDLKYKDIIRIAIYTENIIPDLNYADYILGHYHINYLDRYFKHSIFLWQNFSNINEKRKEVRKNSLKKKFCAAVISNCDSKLRFDFINRLNQYKKVDMGGGCYNNINGKINNKIEFLSQYYIIYKFSIAMENSDGDGYASEKIVDSFLAGTIPIYYGDYVLDEFINPKTYILVKGEKDIDKKIEYIKEIDTNEKLYNSIMEENPLIDKKFIDKIYNNEIKSYLKNIFDQDKNKAFRRDDNFYDFNEDLVCEK